MCELARRSKRKEKIERKSEGEMKGSTYVLSDNKESNAVRSSPILLSVCLSAVGDTLDETSDRRGATVCHPRLHSPLSHIIAILQAVSNPDNLKESMSSSKKKC